ncbi:hypothetical protein [Micromonospora chalcea]|uniref:hypothetical protein n=1 Tax=Micromonospora chalcea TaxID=1874 RepID=UPI003D7355CD
MGEIEQRMTHVRASTVYQIGTAGKVVIGAAVRTYRMVPLEAAVAVTSNSSSALLDPGRATIDFIGRGAELTMLTAWRDAADQAAATALLGRGGAGKTRLAYEFAEQSRLDGWTVRVAAVDVAREATLLEPDERAAGLLVLVDRADAWPVADLQALGFDLAEYGRAGPIRILLVSRAAGRWLELAEHTMIKYSYAVRPAHQLAELVPPDGRAAEFQRAAATFQQILGRSAAPVPEPADLTGAAFGTPLDLHMAALAAVSAPTAPQRTGLINWLRGEEQEYIRRSIAAHGPAIPPDTIADVITLSILFGPLPYDEAIALMTSADLPDAASVRSLVDLHKRLYPGIDDRYLNPMRPDRLAENFVAAELVRPGAASVLSRLLARHANRLSPAALRGCMGLLLLLGEREPRIDALIKTFILAGPALAGVTDAESLGRLSDGADSRLSEAIYRGIPLHHLELMPLARAIAVRFASRPLRKHDPRAYAYWQEQLALRHSEIADHLAALWPARRAVKVLRKVARREHTTENGALLAAALQTQATVTSLAFRRPQMWLIREVVMLYRSLAAADPDEFRTKLAGILSDLAMVTHDLRPRRALAIAREAEEIWESAGGPVTEEQRASFATLMFNMNPILTRLGCQAEAYKYGAVALDLFRELAATRPEVYLRDVGACLINQIYLYDDGDTAVRPLIEEAETIFRGLADREPALYLTDYADTLMSKAVTHTAARERTQALACLARFDEVTKSVPDRHRRFREHRQGAWKLATYYGDLELAQRFHP